MSAELRPPQMIFAGRVEDRPDSPVHDWLTGVLRSLLPGAERLHVATAADSVLCRRKNARCRVRTFYVSFISPYFTVTYGNDYFRINEILSLTEISSDCAAMKRIHSDPLGKSGILMA